MIVAEGEPSRAGDEAGGFARVLAAIERGRRRGRPHARPGCGLSPAAVCQQLVDLANAYGGHDNVTVQLLVLAGAPGERATAAPGAAGA